MIRKLSKPVHGMELAYFAIAVGVIYAVVGNMSLSDVEVIGITGLGAASFAVASRMIDALGDRAISNGEIHRSFDRFREWLLPTPLSLTLSFAGNLAAKVFAGAVIVVPLYAIDEMPRALLAASLVAGVSLALYFILNLLFWVRLWKHLFTPAKLASSMARSSMRPLEVSAIVGLQMGWYHSDRLRHADATG